MTKQKLIVKIIDLKTRINLDKLYNNQKWYQLVKKHKWDELAYPISQQYINRMNHRLSKKHFLHSHRIINESYIQRITHYNL